MLTCAGIALVAAVIALFVPTPRAGAVESPAWRLPASVTWSGTMLRESLRRFADAQALFVVIDRRVDPGAKLELTADRVPAGEIIRSAAHQAGAQATVLGALAYVGPEAACRRLATVAALRTQEAQRLPGPLRRTLLERRAWGWNDFATPRSLVEQLVAETEWELDGLEQVPHDLWAGARLPPLTLVERLSIVLAQFDLTFRLSDDRTTLALTPIPERVFIEKDYPAGTDADKRLTSLRERAPDAEFELRGKRIVVRGTVEEHLALSATDKPSAPADATVEGVQVYTLTVTGKPLNAVLPQLARQLQLELKLDEAALKAKGRTLDHLVNLQVKEATLQQLLDELFQGTELAYYVDLEKKTLEVKAAE